MRVMIGGKIVKLDGRDRIGVGGEAEVYRRGAEAIKIYHAIGSNNGIDRRVAERMRAARLAKIAAFPSNLPAQVVGPRALVHDPATGDVIGFVMPFVDGAEDFRRLGQRSWREGLISNEAVTGLFAALHALLVDLHHRGVVVGDLNDNNVLFTGDTPWLIDADSMQFGPHPCVVGHERFLAPELFGLDLSAGQAYSPKTDWYAFAVLLFSSLLYVHPYGGVHAKLPTLLRRAEAHHSVMRPDVRYPKAAVPFKVLPDPLLDWLTQVFDAGRRDVFPAKLLDTAWTVCRCGLTHAREHCPDCATAVARPPRPAMRINGRCSAKSVFRTHGRILAAAIQGRLKWVYEEDGVVRREDGSLVMRQRPVPGMGFAVSGRSTFVGYQGRLVEVGDGEVLRRTACGRYENLPMFATNARTAFTLDGDKLVDLSTGTHVGQVLEGQTWFAAGDDLGFGFYRASRLMLAFVFQDGKAGLRHLDLPLVDGRIVDLAATFGDDRVLFEMVVEKDGRLRHVLYVISALGELLASMDGEPDSHPALHAVAGKAIVGDRILCTTDEGLLSLETDRVRRKIFDRHLFVDTEPFVRGDAAILPAQGGAIYLVTAREITQLTLT